MFRPNKLLQDVASALGPDDRLVLGRFAVDLASKFQPLRVAMAQVAQRLQELATFEPLGARCFDEWSMRTPDSYDVPGDSRALMAAKYERKDRSIVNPDDVHLINAFSSDWVFVCSSTPWKLARDSGESASPAGNSSS